MTTQTTEATTTQELAGADAAQSETVPPSTADAAAAWVEAFTEGWRNPVDADSFADHFEPWFQPDVRMIQPNVAPVVGVKAFREEFARPLFDLVPDLHGLHTCDRIRLRDGKATERFAYLDPAPLVTAVLRSPRVWPRFVRIQLASRRRGRKGNRL